MLGAIRQDRSADGTRCRPGEPWEGGWGGRIEGARNRSGEVSVACSAPGV